MIEDILMYGGAILILSYAVIKIVGL